MASNKAPVQTPNTSATDDVFEDGDTGVQTSYPPYFEVEEGAAFRAKVLGKDDSDPEFIRWVLCAERPVKCYRGSKKKNQATEIIVQPGELFTIGEYVALRLDKYVDSVIGLKVKGKLEANTPAGFVWDFDVREAKDSRAARLLREQNGVAGQLEG